jgi:hypothetical protein
VQIIATGFAGLREAKAFGHVNDQWKAPTPDLEGHRKRLREALGNTLSDEFVDVILGKLVEALRPGSTTSLTRQH